MKRKRFVKCARVKFICAIRRDINAIHDRWLTMRTRSQTSTFATLVIDFDEASRAWRANKLSLKNGCFAYVDNNNNDDDNETSPVPSVSTRVRRAPQRYT